MMNFKKIRRIDKALGMGALLATAAYAIGMGIYELVRKLQPYEPEESNDIEVEVYEENEDSGVEEAAAEAAEEAAPAEEADRDDAAEEAAEEPAKTPAATPAPTEPEQSIGTGTALPDAAPAPTEQLPSVGQAPAATPAPEPLASTDPATEGMIFPDSDSDWKSSRWEIQKTPPRSTRFRQMKTGTGCWRK